MVELKPEVKEAVDRAIDVMKNSEYGVKAIKVELEAQLNRGGRNGPHRRCDECNGDGLDEDDEVCNACDNMEEEMLPTGDDNFGNIEYCKEWLESHVSKEARKALIYGRFYNDNSVDSEYTFTMPIDKPQYVVEFIEAFKALGEAVGNGIDTTGAGMHIAILNDHKGRYNCTGAKNSIDPICTDNFRYAMNRLMPALFFLASPDHRSRVLNFRMPTVHAREKYSAIATYASVFEYRVFECCYDSPVAFYDMFCVIANSLQFYKKERVVLPFFGTIGTLGFKDGKGLARFYYTTKHLEALNLGLEVLKPSYKTITKLKAERNFSIDENKIKATELADMNQWRQEFKEYRERLEYRRKSYVSRAEAEFDQLSAQYPKEQVKEMYGTREEYLKRARRVNRSDLDTESKYINSKSNQKRNSGVMVTVEV